MTSVHPSAGRGDVLAEKTGLGRTWIGLVLVAATTSLPELFTGLSASAIFITPVRYGITAAVVIAAAVFLPCLGEELARETGLGQALVGTLLIAWSTTFW